MNGNNNTPKISIKDVLAKKHAGGELSKDEIAAIVEGTYKETMDPSQIDKHSKGGVSDRVSLPLAPALAACGYKQPVATRYALCCSVDKHSKGGVSDKVSLTLAPALAACGYKVPMISGVALGHTGGTLDKLEAIPGFTIALDHAQMVNSLQNVGCFIASQTKDICPADKVLYNIRDMTSTVKENGLIASSIVSKKAAENLKALILDVKIGSGAFMETMENARSLAQTMVNCSTGLGIHTRALITDMDTPIGNMIGNTLEVAEAIQCLKGQGPKDLTDLVVALGGNLLEAGQFKDISDVDEGSRLIRQSLQDGSALKKFQEMLQAQNVSTEHAQKLCDPEGDVWSVLERSASQSEIFSSKTGYVQSIAAMPVALTVLKLGGGRERKGEPINHRVGVELLVDVGDFVKEGQAWARIHHDSSSIAPEITKNLNSALVISENPIPTRQTRVREVVKPSIQ
ncbi:thymidine phosphorylase [Plakobranchus ocellatus]|uniref:Thymidine phosphorylase n=1 Tax=Plakobranchus ocellatus TaxID=259542 RepID=A0AAV3XXM7_9GAST|nr:thymidine phosphorylase [Plakobranchus ocellatus]